MNQAAIKQAGHDSEAYDALRGVFENQGFDRHGSVQVSLKTLEPPWFHGTYRIRPSNTGSRLQIRCMLDTCTSWKRGESGTQYYETHATFSYEVI